VELKHRSQFQVSGFKFQVDRWEERVRRWAIALLAVLVGNVFYFAAMPKLPALAKHAPNRLDLGLLVDFCICAAIFVLLGWSDRSR
jgi:hypothetical protein